MLASTFVCIYLIGCLTMRYLYKFVILMVLVPNLAKANLISCSYGKIVGNYVLPCSVPKHELPEYWILTEVSENYNDTDGDFIFVDAMETGNRFYQNYVYEDSVSSGLATSTIFQRNPNGNTSLVFNLELNRVTGRLRVKVNETGLDYYNDPRYLVEEFEGLCSEKKRKF